MRRAFRRLDQELPESLGRAIRWLRHPHSRRIRLPAGLMLIVGGILSILLGLGIWMLPLGLLLIALDVPFLRKPGLASATAHSLNISGAQIAPPQNNRGRILN